MQQQQKHELVREPQKKIKKNWIRHRFWKRNQNRNTSDNSDYEIEEIEEQEQNINEKNKQQNEIKNKKGKKRTIKLLDYLNNSSQDAKKNRQSSSAWKDLYLLLTASVDLLPSTGLHQTLQMQHKNNKN